MESSTRTRLPASRRDAALSPTTLASARDCSAASKSRTTSILVAVCAFSLPMRSRLSKVIVVADHEGFGLGHPDECRDPCSEVRMAVIGHLSRRSVPPNSTSPATRQVPQRDRESNHRPSPGSCKGFAFRRKNVIIRRPQAVSRWSLRIARGCRAGLPHLLRATRPYRRRAPLRRRQAHSGV